MCVQQVMLKYGYFGGGTNPGISPSYMSLVDRIDFSNDLMAATPKGPLSRETERGSAWSMRTMGLPQGTSSTLLLIILKIFPVTLSRILCYWVESIWWWTIDN